MNLILASVVQSEMSLDAVLRREGSHTVHTPHTPHTHTHAQIHYTRTHTYTTYMQKYTRTRSLILLHIYMYLTTLKG